MARKVSVDYNNIFLLRDSKDFRTSEPSYDSPLNALFSVMSRLSVNSEVWHAHLTEGHLRNISPTSVEIQLAACLELSYALPPARSFFVAAFNHNEYVVLIHRVWQNAFTDVLQARFLIPVSRRSDANTIFRQPEHYFPVCRCNHIVPRIPLHNTDPALAR